MVGASVSRTVTEMGQEAVLPLPSSAVAVTTVTPSGNADPDAASSVTGGETVETSAAVAAYDTDARGSERRAGDGGSERVAHGDGDGAGGGVAAAVACGGGHHRDSERECGSRRG